jgi:transposase
VPSVHRAASPQRLFRHPEAMALHLAEIGREVAPGAHATLVFDGAGYHRAKDLAVPENITLVVPPYTPELNPVENLWEYLRANKLAITVFDSYDDIVDIFCAAWRFFTGEPERVPSINPELGRRFAAH